MVLKKQDIASIAIGNKPRFWAITSLMPFLFLSSAIILALYGPGDIIGFTEIFLFFVLVSSIPTFLSLWCLKETEGITGSIFLKSWRLLALSIPLTLLGFGVIFIIKMDTLALTAGLVCTITALLPIYMIIQAYNPLKRDVEQRRKDLINRIKSKKKKKKKPMLNREALRRKEEAIVRRAIERIERGR